MTSKERVLEREKQRGRSDALDLVSRISGMSDTEIIDEEDKIPQFDPNKDYTGYAIGFAVQDAGQTYGLIQPHNASHYPEQRPVDLSALWGVKHTKNPLKAKAYVRPLGTSGLYMKDECYKANDTVYISEIDNNAYTFEEYPQGWRVWEGESV